MSCLGQAIKKWQRKRKCHKFQPFCHFQIDFMNRHRNIKCKKCIAVNLIKKHEFMNKNFRHKKKVQLHFTLYVFELKIEKKIEIESLNK